MTALVSLPTGIEIALGFLLTFGFLLLLAVAENRRPETHAEREAHEHKVVSHDPWASYIEPGKRRRLEAEARDKADALQDVAIIQVEHQPERVVMQRLP